MKVDRTPYAMAQEGGLGGLGYGTRYVEGDRWSFVNAAKWVGVGLGVGAIVAFFSWIAVNTQRCPETCGYATGQRRFVPAHDLHLWDDFCVGHDKDGNCSAEIPIPCRHHVPDKWYVTFTDCKGYAHEVETDRAMHDAPPARVTHVHTRWKECTCKEDWR